MSDNWVVSTLESALETWNDKLTEIWALVAQTPESFRGGEIWNMIVGLNNALVGFGYGLLVLFFAMGVFQSAASFRELQRPEFALRHFIRFLLAKIAVGSSLELISAIYRICGGVVSAVMGGIGYSTYYDVGLSASIMERNLFGRGYWLQLAGFFSWRRTSGTLSFTNPRVYDTNLSVANDLYYMHDYWDNFT